MLQIVSISLFAQGKWSGNAFLDGGTNFKESTAYENYSNSEGNIGLGAKYSSNKFWIGTGLAFLNKYNSSETNGFTIKVAGEDSKADSDILVKQSPQTDYSAYLNGGFVLSERDKLTFDITGKLSGKDPEKAVITFNLLADDYPFNSSIESSSYNTLTAKYNAKWNRTFDKKGRELNVSATYQNNIDSHENEWVKAAGIVKDEDIKDLEVLNNYRVHQKFQEHNISILSEFKEKQLGDIEGLDSDFHLDAILRTNIDHYGSDTLKTEIWKKGQDENFRYFSTTINPAAHIVYSAEKIKVEATFTPQLYLYKLDDETHSGNVNWNVNPLGSLKFRWNMSRIQSLSLSYTETVSRPGYLNMCWFKRQGSYINELYQGNIDLKCSRSSEVSLTYGIDAGKFHMKAEMRNLYSDRKIESTYNNVGKYRIYTWINGGHSNTTAAVLNVGWKSRIISADLTGTLNNYNGVSKSGKRTISNDYNIAGNVSGNFKHGWTTIISARYQSDVKRSYMSMTDYVSCNAKVSKKFKKVELYAEGRDLFDSNIEYGTVSEDETQFRYEENILNRRLIKLGIIINL